MMQSGTNSIRANQIWKDGSDEEVMKVYKSGNMYYREQEGQTSLLIGSIIQQPDGRWKAYNRWGEEFANMHSAAHAEWRVVINYIETDLLKPEATPLKG